VAAPVIASPKDSFLGFFVPLRKVGMSGGLSMSLNLPSFTIAVAGVVYVYQHVFLLNLERYSPSLPLFHDASTSHLKTLIHVFNLCLVLVITVSHSKFQ